MARPRQRLSLFSDHVTAESPRGAHQNFTAQKSAVLKRLAETLVELDKTEAQHFDALFDEEQNARQRYIQQFQSIAGKVQQLSEELEVDRSFRQDYQASIARYTQEQSQEIEQFAQDMVQLRDLEHMVRGHLPVQLEALAALAHDIQVELRQKADMNATKSRLTQINQRLARLEEVIETKADRSELDAQQERTAAIIPDRNRLARCFELIAPAIREPSARLRSPDPVKVQKQSDHSPKQPTSIGGKAHSGGKSKKLGVEEDDPKTQRKPSMATLGLEKDERMVSPRPSVQGKEAPQDAKAKSSTAAGPKADPRPSKLPSGPAPAAPDGKASQPPAEAHAGKSLAVSKQGAASKPFAPRGPPAAVPKDEAVPQAKAPEAPPAQPKA